MICQDMEDRNSDLKRPIHVLSLVDDVVIIDS